MDDQSVKVLAAILGVAAARYGPGIVRELTRPRGAPTYTPEQAAAWAKYYPPDRPRPPSLEARVIAAARRAGTWWGGRRGRRPA